MKELWRGQLDLELTQLDALSQQIADAEKRLEVIAADHEGIQRLQTIPGVGPRTAEVIVTALDDVHRFKNARQVSSYIGFRTRQSELQPTGRLRTFSSIEFATAALQMFRSIPRKTN
jgi:transposase